MFTLPIGIISVLAVFFLSIGDQDSKVYLNSHSFIIVVLGTVAVFFFSNPIKDIKLTWRSLKDLFKKDSNATKVKDILVKLSKSKNDFDAKELRDFPLLAFAVELWDQGVDKDNFESLLFQRFEEMNTISEQPVHVLKSLSKYPPALGMTGTVMGMIALFAGLDSNNKSEIGTFLAIAMTATFYGLIFANFILLPLADRIFIKHQSVMNQNEVVFNALIKINNDEPSTLIENMNIELQYFGQAG